MRNVPGPAIPPLNTVMRGRELVISRSVTRRENEGQETYEKKRVRVSSRSIEFDQRKIKEIDKQY